MEYRVASARQPGILPTEPRHILSRPAVALFPVIWGYAATHEYDVYKAKFANYIFYKPEGAADFNSYQN